MTAKELVICAGLSLVSVAMSGVTLAQGQAQAESGAHATDGKWLDATTR